MVNNNNALARLLSDEVLLEFVLNTNVVVNLTGELHV
jgi:hypothetical protein